MRETGSTRKGKVIKSQRASRETAYSPGSSAPRYSSPIQSFLVFPTFLHPLKSVSPDSCPIPLKTSFMLNTETGTETHLSLRNGPSRLQCQTGQHLEFDFFLLLTHTEDSTNLYGAMQQQSLDPHLRRAIRTDEFT